MSDFILSIIKVNLCLCVCVCICMSVWVHICVSVCVRMCICMHAWMYMCTHSHFTSEAMDEHFNLSENDIVHVLSHKVSTFCKYGMEPLNVCCHPTSVLLISIDLLCLIEWSNYLHKYKWKWSCVCTDFISPDYSVFSEHVIWSFF